MSTATLITREQKQLNSVRDMNEFRNLPFEEQYAIALTNVLQNGTVSGDRTGVGTKRIQSQQIHVDMSKEFPILQGKKMMFKSALVEMMWIMTGRNDLEFLKKHGVNYWDSWVNAEGHFGPIYGPQMRNFGGENIDIETAYGKQIHTIFGADQLKDVVNQLMNTPDSRRIIIDLWNPNQLKSQALPPCHFYYQLCSYVGHDGVRKLDLHAVQRSADSFLGVPYDFLLFAIYLKIMSIYSEIEIGWIHCTFNDFHMYLNHEDQVKQYLDNYYDDPQGIIAASREGQNPYIHVDYSNMTLGKQYNSDLSAARDAIKSTFQANIEDEHVLTLNALFEDIIASDFDFLKVAGYTSYPFIKGQVAV